MILFFCYSVTIPERGMGLKGKRTNPKITQSNAKKTPIRLWPKEISLLLFGVGSLKDKKKYMSHKLVPIVCV